MRFVRSSFWSYLVIFLGIVGGYMISHGDISGLFAFGEMTIVLLTPIGITALTFGWRDTLRALGAVKVLWVDEEDRFVHEGNRQVLCFMVGRVYFMGLLAAVLGLVLTMSAISGSETEIAFKVSHSLVSLVWAVIFSEVLLRPAAMRIEILLRNRAEKADTEGVLDKPMRVPLWGWLIFSFVIIAMTVFFLTIYFSWLW